MVHKNADYFASKDITIVEFGKGDVLLTELVTKADDPFPYVGLGFRSDSPGEIGRQSKEEEKGKSSDEVAFDALMIFDKPESIDVVIEQLTSLKEKLATLTKSVTDQQS